jgi:tRNA 2-thiocytidine biosynthesis protein TtcA
MSRFGLVKGGSLPQSLVRAMNREMGRAMHRYGMLSDGDRVAVGMSGGKDSLALMWFLSMRLAHIPVKYSLVGIHIDPGFTPATATPLARFCEESGWPLRVERTDYGRVAHGEANRENPCFLCARLRRKRLFELAEEECCNKVALGHHKDDLIETLFLNMCYAGEIATMRPKQEFFGGKITVVRPLAYIEERTIIRFARLAGLPEIVNHCPSAGVSKRKEIKTLLGQLYAGNPKVKGNIFRSMSNARPDYLL